MIVHLIGGGPQDGLAWTVPELQPWLVFPYLVHQHPPIITPAGSVARPAHWRSVYVQVGDTDRYTYQGDEEYH